MWTKSDVGSAADTQLMGVNLSSSDSFIDDTNRVHVKESDLVFDSRSNCHFSKQNETKYLIGICLIKPLIILIHS